VHSLSYRRGDVVSRGIAPMFNLRFSPGYYSAIPSWSQSKRNIGWFVRADLEAALLPLFQKDGQKPWISLDGLSDGQGLVLTDDDAAVLYRTHKPLLIGLRGGIFWKFF